MPPQQKTILFIASIATIFFFMEWLLPKAITKGKEMPKPMRALLILFSVVLIVGVFVLGAKTLSGYGR